MSDLEDHIVKFVCLTCGAVFTDINNTVHKCEPIIDSVMVATVIDPDDSPYGVKVIEWKKVNLKHV